MLRGQACLTLGDGYVVRCTDMLLAAGAMVAEPCGDDYRVRNTDATLSATFQYSKTWEEARAGVGVSVGRPMGKAGEMTDETAGRG
jgi:hypothetical protein